MYVFDFLKEYQLQTATAALGVGMIGGTWAIIKQFHDFKLKKREQRHSLLLTEQTKAIHGFVSSYDKLYRAIDTRKFELYNYRDDDESRITKLSEELIINLSFGLTVLRFYLPPQEFKIYQEIVASLHEAHILCSGIIADLEYRPNVTLQSINDVEVHLGRSIELLELASTVFKEKFFLQ